MSKTAFERVTVETLTATCQHLVGCFHKDEDDDDDDDDDDADDDLELALETTHQPYFP